MSDALIPFFVEIRLRCRRKARIPTTNSFILLFHKRQSLSRLMFRWRKISEMPKPICGCAWKLLRPNRIREFQARCPQSDFPLRFILLCVAYIGKLCYVV